MEKEKRKKEEKIRRVLALAEEKVSDTEKKRSFSRGFIAFTFIVFTCKNG